MKHVLGCVEHVPHGGMSVAAVSLTVDRCVLSSVIDVSGELPKNIGAVMWSSYGRRDEHHLVSNLMGELALWVLRAAQVPFKVKAVRGFYVREDYFRDSQIKALQEGS